MPPAKDGMLAGKKAVQEENARLRELLTGMGLAERDALAAQVETLRRQAEGLRGQVASFSTELVQTRDDIVLQEVGVYRYAHPLETSMEYQAWLETLRTQIKDLVKSDRAVTSTTTWQVNGSAKQGLKMVKDISKLMLRAYNAEADNCVRTVKPHNRDASVARLSKTRDTIAKLGTSMKIRVSDELHALRLQEITATADFLARRAEEKEREREERARLREEERVAREIAAAQEKLEKERQQYATALEQLRAKGDDAGVAELEAKLAEIDSGLAGLAERAANTRAGHVYVISNVGSFGDRMVKIGMTRRLVPEDRIRELSDASVPFRYDVHAMFFSPDAVGLETSLHQRFADRKVNLVNTRREFFYATAVEVREALAELGEAHVLQFTEFAEAAEFRMSENERTHNIASQSAPQ